MFLPAVIACFYVIFTSEDSAIRRRTSVVLAITINATFVANFDKRKYEFAIYRALGISNLKIFWKVLSEVLVLDVIGLLFGSAVSAVVMFVIDASMRSRGIVFAHFSINGVLAVLICNTINKF